MPLSELNLDGLPGPTHGFGGLSLGNLASTAHKSAISNPRAAALQGIAKMRLLLSLGLAQGVLPPHPRPHLPTLRALGFTGSDAQVLEATWRADPDLLVAVSSSSAMWTANAATICPSTDSLDGRVHVTPANLACHFHRSIEPSHTAALLRHFLPDCAHHAPLPSHPSLGDEGAANHVRLDSCQMFVHAPDAATRFPARQTARASRAVARLNQVRNPLFLEQSPAAIDAGAFHNDVVCVGSADVLLLHELAFTLTPAQLASQLPGVTLLTVPDSELTLAEAVSTYLFNSQLVPLAGGSLALIAPTQVRDHPRAAAAAHGLINAGTRLRHLHYADLRQSMANGGGPACLRLRVPLTPTELAALPPHTLATPQLLDDLETVIHKHYRTELHPHDLADPLLLSESHAAFDAIHDLLGLPHLPP
jgi:succinylarginine dihydrolase